MESQTLISIAIPTYNRGKFLRKTLDRIMPQISELEGRAEVCISNNGSTDNTESMVREFSEKYPNIIRYSKNEKNLGIDRNIFKVLEMSEGKFVWLMGDDDLVVEDGFKKVAEFIGSSCDNNTGLIALGSESFFIDEKTNKKMVYSETIEKGKPRFYEIERQRVIMPDFPNYSFISVLLFNNSFLKKVLKEKKLIAEAFKARDYIHTFVYQLMFLKFPQLRAVRLNEILIEEELHYYKFFVEDRFGLHYAAKTKLNNILLDSGYAKDYETDIKSYARDLRKNFIIEMAIMKVFETFNYNSYFGCLRTFFRNAPFFDAAMFCFFFIVISSTPFFLIKKLYLAFIKNRFKERWEEVWFSLYVCYYKMSRGERRQMS
jgi:abequosyltransferase